MTASSSSNPLMLTVIIGLYSVHLILGETTEASINDKVQKFDHNQGVNYANVAISKAKNVHATQEPKTTKTQKTFWSNVIPFYDAVKNHLANQNKLNSYEGTNQSYSPSWWYNSNQDNKNLVRPNDEYYGNHLMTSAESNPEDLKNTRYDSTGYQGHYPDNRQDYDEEPEPYIHSIDPTYSDSYSPSEELPPERPAVFGFLRGPPQPLSRFPPVKMCPCHQVAGVRHIITHHEAPPLRQGGGCFGGAFLGLLGTLAATLWSIIQIVAANALPFLIPVVVIKAALVGFKIYKFIKTVKLVLKLLILLPFVLKVVMPVMQNMMQNMMNQQSIVHLLKMRHDDVLENRQSLLFWNIDDLLSAEEMTACASKTACEIGAFVAAKSLKHLPEKFSTTLKKKVDLMEKKKSKRFKLVEQEVVNAFFMAFAKNWTHENCGVYPCSISL